MSAVGPERSRHGGQGGVGGGVRGIIGAPTSPLGLSPKIEEERREGVKAKMIFKENNSGKRRKKVD